MCYQVKKLSPELVSDYISFFENSAFCDGNEFAGCYCTWYHWNNEYEQQRNKCSKEKKITFKKDLAHNLILNGKINGFLAYFNGNVVGWCNVDDKQNYDRLSKINNPNIWKDCDYEDKVLSIVCFITTPSMRGKGVAKELLKEVCLYAEKHEYKYIESYPSIGEFSTKNYHGSYSMYEKLGFNLVDTSKNILIARKHLIATKCDILNSPEQTKLYANITEKLIIDNKSCIIGINGVDTSGKTEFSNRLSKYLSSVGIDNIVIHIDDYHNKKELRCMGDDEASAYYNNAFNYNQLINEVLVPLKKFGYLDKTVCCLDLNTDEYTKNIEYKIKPNTVVFIEGVLLYREPLNCYFDSRIYIDITFDEVLRRAKLRDVPIYGEAFLQKYINKYIPIQKRYISEYNPLSISDIVIDNNDYLLPVVQL